MSEILIARLRAASAPLSPELSRWYNSGDVLALCDYYEQEEKAAEEAQAEATKWRGAVDEVANENAILRAERDAALADLAAVKAALAGASVATEGA